VFLKMGRSVGGGVQSAAKLSAATLKLHDLRLLADVSGRTRRLCILLLYQKGNRTNGITGNLKMCIIYLIVFPCAWGLYFTAF